MRLRRMVGILILFLIGGLLVALLLDPSLLLARLSAKGTPSSPVPATTGNAIVVENTRPGTENWKIPNGRQATTEIQAYASAPSVQPGKNITFYVSTHQEGLYYAVDIYRLGWYGGTGGRLMASQVNLPGHAQGYYNLANQLLVNCGSCRVDISTGLVEANWQPSYSLTVPLSWTTGVYLAKFTEAQGKQTYVPFDVLGNASSAYVAVTPDTTYVAYNDWGGYSLYEANNHLYNGTVLNTSGKGVKASFDRPYVQDYGSSQVLLFEADVLRWMERQGYDVSYISDIDLHGNPRQLLGHKAYLSLGHDEYWTREMRDGVEYARDHGVGLAFLGADAAYWQARLEPDSAGKPNRTLVCYKVETTNNDLARDPLFGKDNTRVTSQWRDPVVGRPENALVGVMFSDLTHRQLGFPWHVTASTNAPLLKGTGLQQGQSYGCGLVGYEWDRTFANGAQPPGLQVLSVTGTLNDDNKPDFGNTTYYIAPSGAFVFATGSIYWTTALDDYRLLTDRLCTSLTPSVPAIQKLMANVMSALLVRHPSHTL